MITPILIISAIILTAFIPYAVAQTTNSTNSTTSQNFSMAQNAGNKVFNQMMCNKDPSYCPGGMNAPP